MSEHPPPGCGISVVTPVRGRVTQTRDLLRSVRHAASRCPVPVEMILVDDSPLPQAAEHRRSCERYGARYVAGTRHVGAKRNLGVDLAKHELIVFLDSDCRASPDLFARYERGMREAPPEVAAIAGPTIVEHAPGWVFRAMSRSELLNADLERPAHCARVAWATTCNLAIRRSAFQAVGGFVTRSIGPVCGEDVDLGLRLTGKGYVIACDPRAVATHAATSTGSLSTVVRRLYNYGRSEQWLTARYPQQRRLRLNPITAVAGVGLLSAFAARRYRYAPVAAPMAACGLLVRDALRAYRGASPRSSVVDTTARTIVEWVFDVGAVAGAIRLRQPLLLFTGFRPTDYEPRADTDHGDSQISGKTVKRTPVRFGELEVPYLYGVDCADQIADALLDACPDADEVVFVVDRLALGHAARLRDRLSQRVRVEPFVVDATEQNKMLPLVQEVLEFATRTQASRRSVVVAMGGGLVGNVAGLVAALLFRGVRLVHLPTTPVAAFDATLSLKQAVNLSGGKNLCGTYHPPTLVAVDLAWLRSIPHRELLTGLAEMAKNVLAVVPDHEQAFSRAIGELPDKPSAAFAALCEIGLAAKRPFLDRDPQERREALIFEYGHTVGHAFEFLSRGRIGHGEAVAWGMLVAARISRDRGHLDESGAARHCRLIAMLDLSRDRIAQAVPDRDAVGEALLRDNKRGYVQCRADEIPMVLLRTGGGAVPGADGYPLVPVAHAAILAVIEEVIWAPCRGGQCPRPSVGAGGTARRMEVVTS